MDDNVVITLCDFAARAISREKWPAAGGDEDVQIQAPHVLVVDDESSYLVALWAMFKKHKCEVSIACTGLQALAFLGLADDTQGTEIEPASKVSLVCSGDNMPSGMTGFELLRKMKESNTTKNVPFVFVASDETPQIKDM